MPNSLGSYLRYLRETQGLTTQDVARKSGVNQSFITRLEIGQRKVTVFRLWQIVRALDGDIRYAIAALAFDLGVPEEEVAPFAGDDIWISTSADVNRHLQGKTRADDEAIQSDPAC